MNLKNVFIIIGIIALVLLIIQYVSQIRRMRQGNNFVSRGRAILNWLLLFVVIGSIGGTVYASRQTKSDSEITETKSISSSESTDDDVYISLESKTARLNSDGVVSVKIIVSPKTKVKIVGHSTGKVYKTYKAQNTDGPVTIKYKFEYAGKYDIIATRGSKKVTKRITIKDAEDSSSSSSSESSASSESSSSRSSSRESSSSNNNNNSNSSTSNNGGSTGSTGATYSGSRGGGYSGGGGGGYTPAQSTGGGSGSSSSQISNQPTISTQPTISDQ